MKATLRPAIEVVTIHPVTSRGRLTGRPRISVWLPATSSSRPSPIGVAIPPMMPAMNSSRIGEIPLRAHGDQDEPEHGDREEASEDRVFLAGVQA